MSAPPTASELLHDARDGSERALGRLLTLVETSRSVLSELQPLLREHGSRARLVGVTGPPGVGKSTLVAALITELRVRALRVAVVAIDPSSPFSGGALLGDRIRMQQHALDQGVFIRSMSSRGHLGGLASATPDVIDVLAESGFDVVLIETVGVGQAEVEIASYADTVVVVAAAGGGDAVQAAKAGILEIGDLFVVNKSDQPGSAELATELRQMLHLGEPSGGFHASVVEVSARGAAGMDELSAELERHRQWLSVSGELARRRHRRVIARLRALTGELVLERLAKLEDGRVLHDAATRVMNGDLDVHSAASELIVRLNA